MTAVKLPVFCLLFAMVGCQQAAGCKTCKLGLGPDPAKNAQLASSGLKYGSPASSVASLDKPLNPDDFLAPIIVGSAKPVSGGMSELSDQSSDRHRAEPGDPVFADAASDVSVLTGELQYWSETKSWRLRSTAGGPSQADVKTVTLLDDFNLLSGAKDGQCVRVTGAVVDSDANQTPPVFRLDEIAPAGQ